MFPRQLKIFTASFENIGDPDEALKIHWNDAFVPPLGLNPPAGVKSFIVGTQCFLEDPTDIALVPEDQLIASLSMNAILSGQILPGTAEYIDAVTSQGTKHFQTIVGSATIDQVTRVSDPTVGPEGRVYDVRFKRVGSAPTRLVRADAWALSQYANRVNLVSIANECVPGAIHKQFGFKKSQLGAAGSSNRQAVIDFVANQYFWI